jgi:hypothetical protein
MTSFTWSEAIGYALIAIAATGLVETIFIARLLRSKKRAERE